MNVFDAPGILQQLHLSHELEYFPPGEWSSRLDITGSLPIFYRAKTTDSHHRQCDVKRCARGSRTVSCAHRNRVGGMLRRESSRATCKAKLYVALNRSIRYLTTEHVVLDRVTSLLSRARLRLLMIRDYKLHTLASLLSLSATADKASFSHFPMR
eukprot:6174259-Pleurochrysis_carterae.AAC.2